MVRTKKLKVSDIAKGEKLPVEPGMDQLAVDNADKGQVYYLTKINAAIEIAKLPSHEQHNRFLQWENDLRNAPKDKETAMGASLLLAVGKVHRAHLFRCARLRTAAAALAVERYRRDNKNWPADLSVLVPKYLPVVPLDPYNGQALRCHSYPDGIAVLSVGLRLQPPPPSFGLLDRRDPEQVVSFRLWHRALRKAPI